MPSEVYFRYSEVKKSGKVETVLLPTFVALHAWKNVCACARSCQTLLPYSTDWVQCMSYVHLTIIQEPTYKKKTKFGILLIFSSSQHPKNLELN